MDLGLKDKVAVVTGASRGIGRAIALGLAGEGCRVACIATSAERAEATAAAARDLGVEAKAYGCDVSDMASATQLAKTVGDDLGPADILVNNAGVTRDGLVLRMSEDDWTRVIDVNLKGTFACSKAFAKTLMKRGGARIINIASVVGLKGNPGQANYSASKGGVIAMTRSMALELAPRKVCVNAVAPGFIETDMTDELDEKTREAALGTIPLRRFGAPSEIAGLVAFLAGDAGAYVTGQVYVMDGGMGA